jgi:GxxExxY protein
MEEKEQIDQITEKIIGAAIAVHRELGPGLLESAYEACWAFELSEMGLKVEQQKPLPLTYQQIQLDCGYRLDLLIEEKVIGEIKSVDQLAPIHQAPPLSSLKISGCKIGLLINFNVKLLKNGVIRLANNLSESPRSLRAPR